MSTLWRDIQYKMLKADSRIPLLIGINVACFLLISIPALSTFSNANLLLSPVFSVLVRHVWSVLTYMFIHDGLLQIVLNMLWLYWMGRIFEEYLGYKRLAGIYMLGGLAGAIFAVAGYNLLSVLHFTVSPDAISGAAICVVAVIVATATLLPEHELSLIIIGPVKLKWLCVFYVALALIGSKDSPGTMMGYVGSGLFGFIYTRQLQRGTDWIRGINKLFAPKPKMKVVSFNPPQKKAGNMPRQDEIDRILDKISASGYDSLSKQEKETLSRASNHNEG